jgi:hypothetical protein
MACINPNDPEFKKILKEVGGNPLLAAIEFNELHPEETVPEVKPGVEEVFDSNFLIFVEAKNAEEVITKLINNNVIEKKCS